MLVYLDTNVYCRPFDDQEQIRIREETNAFEEILDGVKESRFSLCSSDILVYEISNILSSYKKTEVEKYLVFCEKRVEEDEEVKALAIFVRNQCRIKDRDALHLASAILGKVDYFLTCDDEVTKMGSIDCLEKIAGKYGESIIILNPKDFKL